MKTPLGGEQSPQFLEAVQQRINERKAIDLRDLKRKKKQRDLFTTRPITTRR